MSVTSVPPCVSAAEGVPVADEPGEVENALGDDLALPLGRTPDDELHGPQFRRRVEDVREPRFESIGFDVDGHRPNATDAGCRGV